MRALKPGAFALFLAPFLWLFYRASQGGLGPDPAEQIMHVTGEWSVRILIATLLVSPLRQWPGWRWPLTLRRMMGLFVFFYVCIHMMTFCHFYLGWSVSILVEEVVERPYITVGALAWVLLVPLTLTSTKDMQRRLGRNWRRLHRLVYPTAILVCLHMIWQARSDFGEPLLYSVVIGGLLAWRLRGTIALGLKPAKSKLRAQ